MKKKRSKNIVIPESLMLDTTRLRTALLLACMEIAGDPLQAVDLMEEYYDSAPMFLGMLEQSLTGDTAKVTLSGFPFGDQPQLNN